MDTSVRIFNAHQTCVCVCLCVAQISPRPFLFSTPDSHSSVWPAPCLGSPLHRRRDRPCQIHNASSTQRKDLDRKQKEL